MFTLIAIIALVGFCIYYIMTLDFEVGDGFTEAFRQAKKGEYTEVEAKQISEENIDS